MTEREAITKLKRKAYRTTCYGDKELEHEETLVAIEALEKQIPKKPIKSENQVVRREKPNIKKNIGGYTI